MTLTEEIESGCSRLVSGFLEEALMAMKEGGVSKDDLAEGMFMSRSHVYRVFSGDKLPSIEFLVMLEIVLGIKFKVYVPRETIQKPVTWAEKQAYCDKYDISMVELEKILRES